MPTYENAGTAPVFGRGVRQGVLAIGICTVVAGVLITTWPDKTLGVVGSLFGVYLLFSTATVTIVAAGSRLGRLPRGLLFAAAFISLVAAILCFRAGNWAQLLAMWLGLAWSSRGIAHAVAGVWDDDEATGSGRQEVFGLVTLTAGLIIAIAPFENVDTLATVAGCCITAFGAMEVWTALRSPSAVVRKSPITPDQHLNSVLASARMSPRPTVDSGKPGQ